MDNKHISIIREPKLKGESTKKWVYRSLSRAIMSGRFPPGLPVTISGLSESLDVSTMPVRGALDQLIADGALEYLDNRRVRVPDIGPERFDELIAARVSLETVAAERALHFIDFLRIDRLVALDTMIDEAFQAGDIELGIERNFAFHRCMYEGRPSFVLLPLIESVWLRMGPFMREAVAHLNESYQVDRHVEAIEAIKQKDGLALKEAITADIQDGAGHVGRQRLREVATSTMGQLR
ncbi:FCD domain-containing protein [Rhizobium phaseoli]|jgi:DNA-binding GntR family transcriptional regulator|uniref:FCD domain-containing protein n=1 Tax=Rhizobium phaseoli TaxID=396 RepID=A0A7K3U785_9HYPH|nr:GntR family transcriptional regulator [Rhizobium phaseoli]NEJ69552.1 FCD domain-containing protein [Rhizobium phaseoli]